MNKFEDILTFHYNDIEPKPGCLLVSEPFSFGNIFSRSVVLLTNHNEEGSMGLVLTSPGLFTLSDLINDLRDFEGVPVLDGGPLGRDILFFVHPLENLTGAQKIAKGLFLNGDFNELKQLILDKRIDPFTIKFFLGYSGWGANQLESELINDTWVIAEEPTPYIINQSPNLLWKDILQNMGTPYSLWSRYPLIPSFN